MTDDQINAAITQVTGLWDHPYSSDTRAMMDFCRDLNAIHEAEKVLDHEQIELFADTMYNLCVEKKVTQPNRLGWRFALLNATARQRAEAFLRTLGKWEAPK